MNIRSAVALLEAMVATALLAVAVAIALKLFAATAIARREHEHRAIALQQAANVLERISTLPLEQVMPEQLQRLDFTNSLQQALPGGSIALSVSPLDDGALGKSISVEISWPSVSGGAVRPVRLTTVVFSKAKGGP